MTENAKKRGRKAKVASEPLLEAPYNMTRIRPNIYKDKQGIIYHVEYIGGRWCYNIMEE